MPYFSRTAARPLRTPLTSPPLLNMSCSEAGELARSLSSRTIPRAMVFFDILLWRVHDASQSLRTTWMSNFVGILASPLKWDFTLSELGAAARASIQRQRVSSSSLQSTESPVRKPHRRTQTMLDLAVP